MTVEKYRPNKLDDALARVAEECSEVIKIVCKAQRFGLNDHHPKKQKRNVDLLLEELNDVQEAANDLFRILNDMNPSGPEGGFRAALAPRPDIFEARGETIGWCPYEGAGWFQDPILAYRALWDEINGPDSWIKNPWVWVLNFNRLPNV